MVSVQQWFGGSMVHCHTNTQRKEKKKRELGIADRESGINRKSQKKQKTDRYTKQWYKIKMQTFAQHAPETNRTLENPNQVTITKKEMKRKEWPLFTHPLHNLHYSFAVTHSVKCLSIWRMSDTQKLPPLRLTYRPMMLMLMIRRRARLPG